MQRFGLPSRTIAVAKSSYRTRLASVATPHESISEVDSQRRFIAVKATTPRGLPMKAGTPLTNLKIFKKQDAPVTLERSEYPDWVNDLTTPQPGLAALRKIPNEEAQLHEIKRYLKLTRRQAVRQRNEESAS